MDRLRRFAALLPALAKPPTQGPARCAELAHVALLRGFIGLKSHFKELERTELQAKTYRVPAISGSKSRRGYIVWAPDYVANSAGIGCLYRLCHMLRSRGIDACMAGSQRPAPD